MSAHGDDGCSHSERDEHEEADRFEPTDSGSDHESDPVGADSSHTHEENSIKSRCWQFDGTLNLDLREFEEDFMPDMDDLLLHFGGVDCYKSAPVRVIHMHILINLSMARRGGIFRNTFTVPIRLTVQARLTSADIWWPWLESKGILDPSGVAISSSTLIENVTCRDEGWDMLLRSGTRSLYDVRGSAWKFEGSISVEINLDDDVDFVGLATKAFQDSTGAPGALADRIKYMAVLGDLWSR